MLYKLIGGGEVSYHNTYMGLMDELLNAKDISNKIINEAHFNEIDTNNYEELYDWLWSWGKDIAQEFGYSISRVEKEGE